MKYLNKAKESIKKLLEKFLKRYGKIDSDDNFDYYFFENIQRPIVDWIFQIVFTAIPIFLIIFFMGAKVAPLFSLGLSILWWIVIQLVKDLKRC